MDITTPTSVASGWFDLSVPIASGMTVFDGDPPVHIALALSMADGAICNVSKLEMGAHSGTHMDAPRHFIDGAAGTDRIDLEVVMGAAYVVDATAHEGPIEAADLPGFDIPEGETRLLFRTRNSIDVSPAEPALWSRSGFTSGFVALGPSAAESLVARGVRLVGADYLSIAPFGDPAPTHRTLLDAGVVIVEGLDLRAVQPGPIELICLPLRIVDGDGAPARALLRPRTANDLA